MAEIRNRNIPFLPGTVYVDPKRQDFKKSHTFDFKNGLAVMNPVAGKDLGSLPESDGIMPDEYVSFPQREITEVKPYQPDYVKYDRLVLRFYAYAKQTVYESPDESFRVRYFVIDYYVEDGSICILEPKINNSGLPQGQFLKRHKLPKAGLVPDSTAPDADREVEYYSLEDLNIGKNITVYEQVLHIYDCNVSSREFMASQGIAVPDAEIPPQDVYVAKRQDIEHAGNSHVTTDSNDALRKFLENDRKVLRFYCLWDDSTMYGEKRKLVLHYFLADETCEVLEVREANCGRDPFPAFMKRGPLPKSFVRLSDIADSDHVTDKDLIIGEPLDVYNRKVVLYDADEFTKEYYRVKYGVTEFKEVEIEEEVVEDVGRYIPPYNGFGSEEDSLNSCQKGKGVKKDFARIAALDLVVLRFLAEFVDAEPQFEDRKFVISFYPADQSIGIFEPPVRNSGIVGGKFLERQVIKKADGTMFSIRDFKVGAVLRILGNDFIISDADKYAVKWLEENGDKWA